MASALMFRSVGGPGTIEFWMTDTDPSSGGGLAAPLGSFAYVTTGATYFKNSAADTGWTQVSPAYAAGIYGDGSDGAATIVGTVTLTRDMFYTNLTVPDGATLITNGYRVFVNGVLTVGTTGIIDHPGDPGVGGTRGVGAPAGSLAAATQGGSGTAAGGANGTGITASLGGVGGAGGTSASGSGGSGGSVTAPTAANGGIRNAYFAVFGQMFGISGTSAGTNTPIRGGSGGGAGGGNGAAVGGGGGGGGGTVMVAARTCVNNGTIRARGGNGAAFPNVNCGGGGGGGGGVCMIITDFFSGNEPTAPGGSGGAGNGTGAAGSAGNAGTAFRLHS